MKNRILVLLTAVLFSNISWAQEHDPEPYTDKTILLDGTYVFWQARIIDEFNFNNLKDRLDEAFPGGMVDREFVEDDLTFDLDQEPYPSADILFSEGLPDKLIADGKGSLKATLADGSVKNYDYKIYRDWPIQGDWLEITAGSRKQYYLTAGYGHPVIMIKTPIRSRLSMPFTVGECHFTYSIEYVKEGDVIPPEYY